MENDANWAQAENPEVEDGKDAYLEAINVEKLRTAVTNYAVSAVKFGNVDRGWVNKWLLRLGAEPVVGPAVYRINTPVSGVYGKTIKAKSRTEALEIFAKAVQYTKTSGVIDGSHGERVFEVQFDGEPTFFSGPEDPTPHDGPAPDLAGLKVGIWHMVKEGVTQQGWGYSQALNALEAMGLDLLPAQAWKSVTVPVSGVAEVTVMTLEGDGDEEVQQAVTAWVARSGEVKVKPDEIGSPFVSRADVAQTMGLSLVDDDEDDSDF